MAKPKNSVVSGNFKLNLSASVLNLFQLSYLLHLDLSKSLFGSELEKHLFLIFDWFKKQSCTLASFNENVAAKKLWLKFDFSQILYLAFNLRSKISFWINSVSSKNVAWTWKRRAIQALGQPNVPNVSARVCANLHRRELFKTKHSVSIQCGH